MPRILATVHALLALYLLPGCVTESASGRSAGHLALSGRTAPDLEVVPRDSSGAPSPLGWLPGRETSSEAMEQARESEAEWAQAEWEFRFWSQGGALTLLSFRRTEDGEDRLAPIGRRTFLPRLGRELPTLLGLQPRSVILTIERQETGWSADLDTSSEKEPPSHARTMPSTRTGTSGEAHQQVLDTARRITRVMFVPRGGSAEFVARVSFDDGRVESWDPEDLDSSGDGPALVAREDAVNLIVTVLLPFTRGLGERTVLLSFEGRHRHGEMGPRWHVTAARVLEPAPLPAEVADIHHEYRALHEYILTEFQKQTREYAVLAAGFTLEQIAYSVVGGLALKGAWVLIGKGAPTVISFLSRGGRGAVLWFRNLLVRTPAADRELLLQLWMKAETQGLKALTEVEKQELRAVMLRLEKVLETPLGLDAKRELRRWSRQIYFELYNPRLARVLGEEGMKFYQVHHICPMEYAHLFPKLDITGKANLVGVHEFYGSSAKPVGG